MSHLSHPCADPQFLETDQRVVRFVGLIEGLREIVGFVAIGREDLRAAGFFGIECATAQKPDENGRLSNLFEQGKLGRLAATLACIAGSSGSPATNVMSPGFQRYARNAAANRISWGALAFHHSHNDLTAPLAS